MRTLVPLLLLALPLAAAPVPKSLKKPANPLAGEWVVTDWYIDDAQMRRTEEARWSIDGEKLTVTGKGPGAPEGFQDNVRRTITRPEGGGPNAFDYTILPNDGDPVSLRPAVIEFVDDTFTICMSSRHNGTRPTACVPTQGTIMYTLKRVEK
jgi:uncharacterized protein (TIGR03067 family)